MSFKIKAALACVALTLSLGTLTTAQAAKRLTVPDPDWTGGVVTCRTIQYVLENELDYKIKTVSIPGGPGEPNQDLGSRHDRLSHQPN